VNEGGGGKLGTFNKTKETPVAGGGILDFGGKEGGGPRGPRSSSRLNTIPIRHFLSPPLARC